MVDPNTTCGVEVGLLKKKPCGSPAVAACSNCEMPLCTQHAIAELTESGKRSGKFICKECSEAAKERAKALAAVARSQEEKKKAEIAKAVMQGAAAAPQKKPAAPAAPAAAAAAAAAPQARPAEPEKKDDSGALEFTPKDGNFSYTTKKKDDPGFKGD